MKARVKATGEIIEVVRSTGVLDENSDRIFPWYEVETLDSHSDDYWTRLEHQYAGMAMQGILGNPEIELDYEGNDGCVQAVTATAARFAHALVEKMKEKRK